MLAFVYRVIINVFLGEMTQYNASNVLFIPSKRKHTVGYFVKDGTFISKRFHSCQIYSLIYNL